MLFRVLGPLEVADRRGPVAVGGPVPRRVLTALLGRVGTVVTVDSLVEAAWGERPPASSERTLLSHVTRLRDALSGTDDAAVLVERRGSGYVLTLTPDALDAEEFERLVGQAAALPAADAAPVLRRALDLWRTAVPYADLVDTAYPAAEAARLLELRGSAYESLGRAQLAAGKPDDAAAEARGRLRDDPYREGLWEVLILALYRQGRQADALEAFRAARTELREGLGVDPGPRLRELEAQVLAQDPRLLVSERPRRAVCPYKGLARYDEADAGLFVGREALVDELVARLVDGRLVVVTGPSGAGKSSLVRAGLVAALGAGAIPGSDVWSVDVVSPGSDPVAVLDDALASRPDVLVVDQGEEAVLADEGDRVVDVGDRLLRATGAGTRVVLVVRADFYAALAQHPTLARLAGPATVLVGPPGAEDVRRIVVEPAARVGLVVEPELADLVVAEVGTRPGGLPVLSTALVRTWEHREGDRLTVAAYHAGGGVRAALERVGEEAWATLDDEQRVACRRILLRLATDEDGAWVRRWVRRGELVHPDDTAGVAVLGVLTDRRLVVARADDLGIAHEALLAGWPRLRGWLEDGRARVAVLDRLAAATAAWEQSGRDATELYRGTRLQAALDTAAASPADLAPVEADFLAESSAAAGRELADQRARADREARGRRRTRVVAVVLAVVLAFAASAGGYALVQQRRAQAAALKADAERLGALAQSDPAYDKALLLAAEAVKLDPTPVTESDLFAAMLRGDSVIRVRRASDALVTLTFSHGGRSVLGMTGKGTLVRWPALGDGAPTQVALGLDSTGFAELPDGTVAAEQLHNNSEYTEIRVVDPDTGRVLSSGAPHDSIGAGSNWTVSPDRRFVVYAPFVDSPRDANNVEIWRIGTPIGQYRRVDVGGRPVSMVRCTGAEVCVLTENDRVVRVDTVTGRTAGGFAVPKNSSHESIGSSADGRVLAVSGSSGLVHLLDTRSGRQLTVLSGARTDPHILGFSPDGTRLAASDGSTVLVWRTDRAELVDQFESQGGGVVSAVWSADGSTLVTGGQDGALIEWDVGGRQRVGSVLNADIGDSVNTLWTTPSAILVGGLDGRLLFVDPSSGAVQSGRWTAAGYGKEQIATVRADRGGGLAVSADRDGRTAVWDVPSRTMLGTVDLPLAPSPSPYGTATWVSPDGTRAATLRNADGPIVFDVRTRQVVARLHLDGLADHPVHDEVQGWTADGRSLLVTMNHESGSTLVVMDAVTGSVRFRVSTGGFPGEVTADPTGRYLAVAFGDGTLQVYDAHDGHHVAGPLAAVPGNAYNVSFSPDGRYLAGGGWPATASVWDTRTFTEVAGLLPIDHDAPDTRVRFTLDGRLVLAGGSQVRTFEIDPTYWLARACREAGRTLTREEWAQLLPGRPYAPAC